jgi:hypothetical protein
MLRCQDDLVTYSLGVSYIRSYEDDPATLELSGCHKNIDWAEGRLRK